MVESIQTLLDGLQLCFAEGFVLFDRPAAVRHLATATLRGVAGHCLGACQPGMLTRCFRPGQDGSCPPAGLFQPLHDRATTADGFPFRIVTWDSAGEFLPALMESLAVSGPGRPFGSSGARIAEIRFGSIGRLVHAGAAEKAPCWKLTFRTPLCLEREGRLIEPQSLSLGHVAHATVWRLNLLSEHYGNGQCLDPVPWMAEASLARELWRDLEQVEPKRWSSTQGRGIALAGTVGELVCSGMSPDLAALLLAAGAVHLGKHTMEGCGQVLLDPALPTA